MIPLHLIAAGAIVIVSKVNGSDTVRKRILDLGIIPGEEITVVSATPGNPLIVKINQSKLVIDSSTCKRIMVRP